MTKNELGFFRRQEIRTRNNGTSSLDGHDDGDDDDGKTMQRNTQKQDNKNVVGTEIESMKSINRCRLRSGINSDKAKVIR